MHWQAHTRKGSASRGGPVVARPLSPQAAMGLRGLTLYAPDATNRISELLGKAPRARSGSARRRTRRRSKSGRDAAAAAAYAGAGSGAGAPKRSSSKKKKSTSRKSPSYGEVRRSLPVGHSLAPSLDSHSHGPSPPPPRCVPSPPLPLFTPPHPTPPLPVVSLLCCVLHRRPDCPRWGPRQPLALQLLVPLEPGSLAPGRRVPLPAA